MPQQLPPTPTVARSALTTPIDPQPVVEAFLDALAAPDLERAAELLADDVVYSNVGLPTITGRDKVIKALRFLERPTASFEVYVHAMSSSASVVLTERTDVLAYRRFRSQFWVTGRFDVTDGQITLWRDSFDFVDVLRGTVRGLVASAIPTLAPAAPLAVNAVPGRHSGRVH